MALSNMKVFNDFAYLAATETIDQQVRLFNEAAAGTISLSSERNVGDYTSSAMYKAISGLVRYRNAYGSGSVNAKNLEQLQMNSVKVAGGSYPVAFEPQQLSHLQRNTEEAATMIGIQFAEAQFQQLLNTAITAAVAACTGNAAVQYDGIAGGTVDFRALNQGAKKFGDRAAAIRAWVIHGYAVHDLYDNALANSEQLFKFGDVAVNTDAFGRRLIITDCPALVIDDTAGGYNTLGLVQDAIMVGDNNDLRFNLDTTNGYENIKTTWQAEYTFQLALKGYSWNLNWNGGTAASPTEAALGTSGNWVKAASSNKDTLGVMVLSAD